MITSADMVGKPSKDDAFPWTPTETAEQKNIPLLKNQLMSCPFCGGRPSIRVCGTHSGYKVTCDKCGIPKVTEYWGDFCTAYAKRTKRHNYDIPWNISLAGTMNRIIKRWNQRD